jgi:hypothetical protein
MRTYERKIKNFDVKISKREEDSDKVNDDLPVNRAYVVFEDVEHRKACIAAYYAEEKCCRRRRNQPARLKINGTHHVRVVAAVEPSNILWENLEVSKCERRMRRAFVVFCTGIIIICSIALIYYVKTQEEGLPTDRECADEEISWDDLTVITAKATLSGETQEFCWCKSQTVDDLVNDNDINDYCTDYIEKVQSVNITKVFSACGVVIINFIIKIVLISLSKWERAATLTKETLKIMTKVFVAMFINTAFISLIVNADL